MLLCIVSSDVGACWSPRVSRTCCLRAAVLRAHSERLVRTSAVQVATVVNLCIKWTKATSSVVSFTLVSLTGPSLRMRSSPWADNESWRAPRCVAPPPSPLSESQLLPDVAAVSCFFHCSLSTSHTPPTSISCLYAAVDLRLLRLTAL